MSDLLKDEYRVVVVVVGSGGRASVRREGPWHRREAAEAFASGFKLPKFSNAWVEGRTTTPWAALKLNKS